MNASIIFIIVGAFAAAGFPALLTGSIGITMARRARRAAETGACRTGALEMRIAALDAALLDERNRTTVLGNELEQLNLQLGRVDSNALRMGLREAIALSRRGADAHELVATCGIGYGEARLIGLLHGNQPAEGAVNEPN